MIYKKIDLKSQTTLKNERKIIIHNVNPNSYDKTNDVLEQSNLTKLLLLYLPLLQIDLLSAVSLLDKLCQKPLC